MSMRPGPRARLVGDLQVHAVLDEAQQPADTLGVVERLWVRPGDVLLEPVVEPERPVVGDALVGAARRRVAGLEEVGTDILERVVPKRTGRPLSVSILIRVESATSVAPTRTRTRRELLSTSIRV